MSERAVGHFKVVTIGEYGTGKSSLLNMYVYNSCEAPYCSGLGVDYCDKTLTSNGKKTKMRLWDTAGQERFGDYISKSYIRGAVGVMVVYDITNRTSFDRVEYWCEKIKGCIPDHHVVQFLLGNKSDLADMRVVSYEEGEALATKLGTEFVEVSAKTGDNVDYTFQKMCDCICDMKSRETPVAQPAPQDQLMIRQDRPACYC